MFEGVHTMRAIPLLAACLVAGVGVAGSAGAADAKCKFVRIVDWPVRMVRNHIVVDGAINGQKIGIILDTGASMSLILRSAAVRLDLPKREAPGYRMYGVGGETKVEIAVVDDFKLGEVSTKGLQLFVAGEGDFGEGQDVLLGEDFLRRFDVEFDLAHGAVRLYQPRDCDGVSLAYWTKETAGEVEIEPMEEGRPRIALTVHINGRPIEAKLDSGASTSVLTKEDAASLGVTPDTPGVVAGRPTQGLGAKGVGVWSGPFQSFAIGNESIPDVRIRFADLYKDTNYTTTASRVSKKASRTQPMLLGADFLRAHRTLVAHSQQRLYFTYVGGPVFLADPATPRPAPRPDGDPSAATGSK
jgi:predicted aspartyl protease